MSSSCEAVNASINFESTLVRVPSDSFRYKATLAASSVLMSKKYVPADHSGLTTPKLDEVLQLLRLHLQHCTRCKVTCGGLPVGGFIESTAS